MFILGTGPIQPVIRAHFTGEMNQAVDFLLPNQFTLHFCMEKAAFSTVVCNLRWIYLKMISNDLKLKYFVENVIFKRALNLRNPQNNPESKWSD